MNIEDLEVDDTVFDLYELTEDEKDIVGDYREVF